MATLANAGQKARIDEHESARIRKGRLGPRGLSKRNLLSRAMQLGWPEERIEQIRAEFIVTKAAERLDDAQDELQEAVEAAPGVDYDALVADWPELSPEVKDRLRAVLQ